MPNARLPLPSISTTRSYQPLNCLIAWLTGSASKNSLARTMTGPSGTSSKLWCHITGTSSVAMRLLLPLLAAPG